jgi:hypothetical protein
VHTVARGGEAAVLPSGTRRNGTVGGAGAMRPGASLQVGCSGRRGRLRRRRRTATPRRALPARRASERRRNGVGDLTLSARVLLVLVAISRVWCERQCSACPSGFSPPFSSLPSRGCCWSLHAVNAPKASLSRARLSRPNDGDPYGDPDIGVSGGGDPDVGSNVGDNPAYWCGFE